MKTVQDSHIRTKFNTTLYECFLSYCSTLPVTSLPQSTKHALEKA